MIFFQSYSDFVLFLLYFIYFHVVFLYIVQTILFWKKIVSLREILQIFSENAINIIRERITLNVSVYENKIKRHAFFSYKLIEFYKFQNINRMRFFNNKLKIVLIKITFQFETDPLLRLFELLYFEV